MARKFRVFLGAPAASDFAHPSEYQWHTFSSTSTNQSPAPSFEAARDRISLIYQNIIFKDDEEDESLKYENPPVVEDNTTFITWAPTPSRHNHTIQMSNSRFQESTFFDETQDTYNYSDSSSIARFPRFHINPRSLNSVSSLSSMVVSSRMKGTLKVNVLMAVLEVDGPNTITIKKGREAGKQVSLLKMILGEEDGNVCKLTAWREVAELWGNGNDNQPPIRRGDVVWFQNVLLCWEPPTTTTLNFTASPYLQPKAEICYRTMAYCLEDNRLRPDLRLGYTDASVRKVASVVSWFEQMAGL